MVQFKPEIEGAGIVLVGSFTPQIFQPAWFALHHLISKEAADAAKVDVIHSQFCKLTIESVRFEITPERVGVSTDNPSDYELLRDLTLGSFHVLHYTPIRAMGLNWNLHFKMRTEAEWHVVGDRLAPKASWKEILKNPGMRSLTMEGQRPDDLTGVIVVRVEPSKRVHPGIYITVNDHVEIPNFKVEDGCEAVMNILNSNWKPFFERSKDVFSPIIEGK